MTMAARDESSMQEELAPGSLLVGKYMIDKVLGKGGVGVVVAATHVALEQKVAIKFLRNDTTISADTLQRFLREARAAAMIRSEHVARVHDFGTSEGGHPYIVMEHLEGKDLGALLDEGRVPFEDAVEYVLQACLALAEAHRAGIVHRDLKPANLFLTQRADGVPVIKVLDFGISKIVPKTPRGSNAELLTTSAIMGSPEYMSPEQMRSTKDVDPRADIWALGVVLYELITSHPAFTADSVHELFYAIDRTEPTPIETYCPNVPPVLRQVIARCLMKNREERYDDVGQLAVALRPVASARAEVHVDAIVSILSGVPSTAKPPIVHRAVPADVFDEARAEPVELTRIRRASAPTVGALTSEQPRAPFRMRTLGLAAAAVLSGGFLAVLVFGMGRSAPAPPPGPSASSAAPVAASAAPPPPVTSAQSSAAAIPVDSLPTAAPIKPSPKIAVPGPKPIPRPTASVSPPPVVEAPPVAPKPVPKPASTSNGGTTDYGDRK